MNTARAFTVNETVNLEGIVYKIVSVRGFVFHGEARHELSLRRPNGRKIYHAVIYSNGSISSVI